MNLFKKFSIPLFFFFAFSFASQNCHAKDGYKAWLNYERLENHELAAQYISKIEFVQLDHHSEVTLNALKELDLALNSMLGEIDFQNKGSGNGIVLELLATGALSQEYLDLVAGDISQEGYIIKNVEHEDSKIILISGGGESGLLYGVFNFINLMQKHQDISKLKIVNDPKVKHRILNHWDNLDGTVERGYAGFSIWNWHQLPEFIDQRYIDYARLNASIGINGTVVTNVNANALIFRDDYLEKAKALADVFRGYGIKLYLTARFSAPIELEGLKTADPLDEEVIRWWEDKVRKIYELIPDFGGFVVKANSEGQPGPREYGRNHAEGANLLANALKPFGGIVMWRAFVYDFKEGEDRAKQAYDEFVPLDGEFAENVIIQVKNGPIDFQPREPIHPLFGALKSTSLMLELQITKEYLGQGTHLVGLANMYEEILKTDTYSFGKGSEIAKIVDGSLTKQKLTAMAGVSNIGSARNWTGNYFGQCDWYAFGRLAWDPHLDAESIFSEWINLSFGNDNTVNAAIFSILDQSYEHCVNYMTPVGLHHIMATGHHYGPGPWVSDLPRDDWNPVYYHQASQEGVGFDRTVDGSGSLQQYADGYQSQYENSKECPETHLLWFHHVPWDFEMDSGRSLWDEMCFKYQAGVDGVKQINDKWELLEDKIDPELFRHVSMHLKIQMKEATWWKDACLTYFQEFSKMDFPAYIELPEHDLEHYREFDYPYSPGIRPKW